VVPKFHTGSDYKHAPPCVRNPWGAKEKGQKSGSKDSNSLCLIPQGRCAWHRAESALGPRVPHLPATECAPTLFPPSGPTAQISPPTLPSLAPASFRAPSPPPTHTHTHTHTPHAASKGCSGRSALDAEQGPDRSLLRSQRHGRGHSPSLQGLLLLASGFTPLDQERSGQGVDPFGEESSGLRIGVSSGDLSLWSRLHLGFPHPIISSPASQSCKPRPRRFKKSKA
jgi:hypothetical protein